MSRRRPDLLSVWIRLALVMGVTAAVVLGAGYLMGHTLGPLRWP